jgi:hypothetical protein
MAALRRVSWTGWCRRQFVVSLRLGHDAVVPAICSGETVLGHSSGRAQLPHVGNRAHRSQSVLGFEQEAAPWRLRPPARHGGGLNDVQGSVEADRSPPNRRQARRWAPWRPADASRRGPPRARRAPSGTPRRQPRLVTGSTNTSGKCRLGSWYELSLPSRGPQSGRMIRGHRSLRHSSRGLEPVGRPF